MGKTFKYQGYYNKGYVEFEKKDYDTSINSYQEALKWADDNVEKRTANYMIARNYEEKDFGTDVNKAESYARKAAEYRLNAAKYSDTDSERADQYFNAGVQYWRAGSKSNACNYMRQAASLTTNPNARKEYDEKIQKACAEKVN